MSRGNQAISGICRDRLIIDTKSLALASLWPPGAVGICCDSAGSRGNACKYDITFLTMIKSCAGEYWMRVPQLSLATSDVYYRNHGHNYRSRTATSELITAAPQEEAR